MEGVQESTSDQILWPNHTRGLDDQPTAEASHSEPGRIARENHQDFVPNPVIDAVVLLLGHEHLKYKRRYRGSIPHHEKERVLLYIPWSRV